MILIVHIVTSSLLFMTSISSALVDSKSKIQLWMLWSIVLNAAVSFISGMILIANGGNLARLCTFGLATIMIAVFTSRRIVKSNQIKLEI